MRIAAHLPLLLSSTPAVAHGPFSDNLQERLAAGPGIVVLALFWLVYLSGSRQRSPSRVEAACFHLTAVLAAITLFGPLDHWAKTSTAAHMTQHMLMMVVIAPLWVLSHPLPQLRAGSRGLGRWWQPLLRLAAHPMLAAWLHAAAIWLWHMPRPYTLAIENPWWHALEHACFLLTAGLFWWAVLNCGQRRAPWALLAVLLTLMHTGFLGAVLTFANAPLYGEARELADQQLAGLIMWVPGAVPYLLAATWVAHLWYQRLSRWLP